MESPATVIRPHQYRPDIDGLRAVAVIPVVAYHLFPKWITGGFIGVDIFFVISGYLISSLILHDLLKGTFSYKQFYIRRIRRIFPALICVLVSTVLTGWFLLPEDEFKNLGKHIASAVVFISNFVFWNESGYFDATAEAKPLLHLWSLAIEEQFYIFWPLLIGLFWKRRKVFLCMAISLIAVSMAVNVFTTTQDPTAAFYSPLSRIWELLAGALVAYLHLQHPKRSDKLSDLQSLLGVILLLLAFSLVTKSAAFPGWWATLPTLGACLLIYSGADSCVNKYVLSQPPIRWVGTISYPMYLWHWPMISLAFIVNHYQSPSAPQRVVIFFLTILLAWLTTRLIEKPVRFGNKVATRSLTLAFISIGLIGGLLYLLDGVPSRSINQDAATRFINSYAKLHKFGMSDYYQEKCDLYDWKTGNYRQSISSDCMPMSRPSSTVLLWGDSHAQALSHGFRKNLSSSTAFSQITTSGCKPNLVTSVNTPKTKDDLGCQQSNRLAMQYIANAKPNKVFVAQAADHDRTDWESVASFVRQNGGEFVLIGPVPQWRPSLPVIAAKQLPKPEVFQNSGLDLNILDIDAKISKKYATSSFQFVSVIQSMCKPTGCRATLETTDQFNLLLLDYGHLTPAGSDFIVRELVLKP
jgi:peptidoglycan/LPS O-acetylase OafA/YrhL